MITLYVGPSEIHGRGCFTTGVLRPATEFHVPSYRTDIATDYSVSWHEDGDWYELYSPFKFINHSEKPNAECYLADDDTWNLYILRQVAADEEITIHYGVGSEPESSN